MGKRRAKPAPVVPEHQSTRRTRTHDSESASSARIRPYISLVNTSLTRASPVLSAATTTREELSDLDSGRCLITLENTPSASQQVAHVCDRKTPSTVISRLALLWRKPSLDINLIQNLVTLREDWHLSFNHGDWVFVPAQHVLQRILQYGQESTFDTPYPGFKQNGPHDYVFIPLPTLEKRLILRVAPRSKRATRGKAPQKNKQKEKDAGGEDMMRIDHGRAILHITPFSSFPSLHSHIHPFYAINKGLNEMFKHRSTLCKEHASLLTLMENISCIWRERLPKITLGKRRRTDDHQSDNDCEDLDDDDDDNRQSSRSKPKLKQAVKDTPQTKTYETRSKTVGQAAKEI